MKVLKKGREQKGWAKEYECTGNGNGGGGCGAILLVNEGDVYQTSRGYYDGSTDYYWTFQCCECHVETDMPPGEVPARVKGLAKNNKSRPYDRSVDIK